jgi:xylulokinase
MRGGLLGLAMNHTPAHIARSVLEGCAFALRDIVDRLDALGLGRGEVRIVSGGAQKPVGGDQGQCARRPVRRVLTEEATAVSAAMVAGVGTGFFRTSPQHRLPSARTAAIDTTPRRPRSTRTPTAAIAAFDRRIRAGVLVLKQPTSSPRFVGSADVARFVGSADAALAGG